MSWDERLFGRMHRAFAATRRRVRPPAAHAATFTELGPRLRLLACALAGTEVEVVAGADDDAPVGRIVVPAAIELMDTAAANAEVYRMRIAYAAAALRLGLVRPADADPAGTALATLLAWPAVRDASHGELPGLAALWPDVARRVLATRAGFERGTAALARLERGTAALETLAQLHLGRTPEDLAGRVAADVRAWAEAAARCAPGTREELREAIAACTRDGLGSGRLAPVVPWGVLARRADANVSAPRSGAEELVADDLPAPGATERERPTPPGETRHVDLGKDDAAENPAVHSFEKVHTAEEYRGGKKRVDAEDELADHAEALDELDLREVVRSRERTRSLYRADLYLDGGVGDLEGETPAVDAIPYDEWDARRRYYRPGWCSLRATRLAERRAPADARRWCRDVLARRRSEVCALEAAFLRLEQARRWKDRQPDGPDIDVDALVRRHATLRSGHAPPDRLYCARRRHGQDVAILVLLDASLSTDAWVAGRRVLDVARESVLVLGEALAATPIALGIAAFASHTRRDCRFATVKGFAEPWAEAAPRLASVEPAGYTRIGPALRHATRVLEAAPARRRLLLLVSDGKPTDYDRYEGRYGVADVRQAVREAQQRTVGCFALAIDATARFYLPQLFGRGNYALLPRPDALGGALARVVAEAVR